MQIKFPAQADTCAGIDINHLILNAKWIK